MILRMVINDIYIGQGRDIKKDKDVQTFIAQHGLNIPDFSSASARMGPVLACGGSRVSGSLFLYWEIHFATWGIITTFASIIKALSYSSNGKENYNEG